MCLLGSSSRGTPRDSRSKRHLPPNRQSRLCACCCSPSAAGQNRNRSTSMAPHSCMLNKTRRIAGVWVVTGSSGPSASAGSVATIRFRFGVRNPREIPHPCIESGDLGGAPSESDIAAIACHDAPEHRRRIRDELVVASRYVQRFLREVRASESTAPGHRSRLAVSRLSRSPVCSSGVGWCHAVGGPFARKSLT